MLSISENIRLLEGFLETNFHHDHGSPSSSDTATSIDVYEPVVKVYLEIFKRVDTVLSIRQIRSPTTYTQLILPLRKHFKKALNAQQISLPFIYLYVRGVYQKLASYKSHHADINETRANIAESLAIYSIQQDIQRKGKSPLLTLAFCSRFIVPFRNKPSIPGGDLLAIQTTRRMKKALRDLNRVLIKEDLDEPEHTLETAVRTESKRFIMQPIVQQVTDDLWYGKIRWKGHELLQPSPPPQQQGKRQTTTTINDNVHSNEDVDTRLHPSSPPPLPPALTTSTTMYGPSLAETSTFTDHTSLSHLDHHHLPSPSTLYIMPNGAHYTPIEINLARILSPLRTPFFQNSIITAHFAIFLFLHFMVLFQTSFQTPSWYEVLFGMLAIAQIIDEVRQVKEVGPIVYSKNLWNALDIIIYFVYITYLMAISLVSVSKIMSYWLMSIQIWPLMSFH